MRHLTFFALAAILVTAIGCGGSGQGIPTPVSPVTTESGLQYADTVVGTGATAATGQTVTVNYTGWLTNGTVFDSSKKPGRTPFSFKVGNNEVIDGWDEGIPGMKVGGTRILIIPPGLGYGSTVHGDIPANSTLRFEVELVSITN